jgi:hypothetical protein
MDVYPTWNDTYKMFVKEDFPRDDEDMVIYQSIKKSGLYIVATRPTILPYNDVVRWVFSHLDSKTSTMVNEYESPIASLKPDEIHARYHLQNFDAYLNKQLLDTFGEEHPNLAELVKEWWNEDRSFT